MSHILHLGDCIEGMRQLPDKSVDHAICDPPYSEHVHANARTNSKHATRNGMPLGFDSLSDADRALLAVEYARLAKRWVLVFGTAEEVGEWRNDLRAAGLEYIRTGAWIRKGAPQITGDRPAVGWETICIAHRPGRKRWNGGGTDAVWTFPIPRGDERHGHATPKPLDLMRALVSLFTNPGETVLDSHAGSGTTGAACIELGRDFIGFEKDPKHHATATARLARCVVDLGAVQRQGMLLLPKPKQLALVNHSQNTDLP